MTVLLMYITCLCIYFALGVGDVDDEEDEEEVVENEDENEDEGNDEEEDEEDEEEDSEDEGQYSALSIYCQFSLKNSWKAPHILPLRMMYGVSLVSGKSDQSFTIESIVLCTLSCYIWLRYACTCIESLEYAVQCTIITGIWLSARL